ncbi:MAG: PIN domain-containing protein [Coriobacteriaceae bacterium]|jgi:predicted nucleic acid-binding protein|nr:PIN domain-containing protein [Coriobacteriaceae bacterium]
MVLLLDCNVVLDKLGRREPFYDAANRVFLSAAFGDTQIFISANMLTDILYLLKKQLGNQISQSNLLAACEILHIAGLSADDCLWALRQGWDDFEDCLVSRCAENIRADYIVTRDSSGFSRSLVPAISPEALLALLEGRGLAYCDPSDF